MKLLVDGVQGSTSSKVTHNGKTFDALSISTPARAELKTIFASSPERADQLQRLGLLKARDNKFYVKNTFRFGNQLGEPMYDGDDKIKRNEFSGKLERMNMVK
jgi:hypothetical protein